MRTILMLQFNDVYVIVCLLCTEIFFSSFIIAIITMTLVLILIYIIMIIKKNIILGCKSCPSKILIFFCKKLKKKLYVLNDFNMVI